MLLRDAAFTLSGSAAAIDCGWGCELYEFPGKKKCEYHALVERLVRFGAELREQSAIGDNETATLSVEDGDVIVTFRNYDHNIRVVLDPLTDRIRPNLQPEYFSRVTKSALGVIALDYSHRDDTDGNGMSYVLTLADGSYLIYDGGYRQDADNLYAYLRDHNKRADGKIVIAGWLLTHSHCDHYFCLLDFTEKYADRVTVEQFIANPRTTRHEGEQYDAFLPEQLPEFRRRYKDAELVKPHTGQHLRVRDAVVEILFTQEDYGDAAYKYLNESSIVSRVFLGGQSILFMADAEIRPDTRIPVTYGDALKSDFWQTPHHGYSGGSRFLFDLVSPRYAMWTTNRKTLDLRIENKWPRAENEYYYTHVERAFVADEGCKTLTLPYNGEEPEIYFAK